MTRETTLGLGMVATGIAAVLVALFMAVSSAFAAGDLTASSETADADGAATVTVTGEAPSDMGIGNWDFTVSFASDVTVDGCSSHAAGACTITGTTVQFAGATGELSGLTGAVELGSVDVTVDLEAGECTDATIAITQFQDQDGTDFDSPTVTNGEVCVEAEATATATEEPTASPTELPGAGGPAGSSSSSVSTLTWLLAAAGLAVVAGGAWALARAGREN